LDGVKSYLLVLLDRSLGYEICNVGGEAIQQNNHKKKNPDKCRLFLTRKYELFSVSRLFYTDKKEKKIFLIYKEIQMGSGAKLYMRRGFLIYEENLFFLRKYLDMYEEAALFLFVSRTP
jgi:hypothetical protein